MPTHTVEVLPPPEVEVSNMLSLLTDDDRGDTQPEKMRLFRTNRIHPADSSPLCDNPEDCDCWDDTEKDDEGEILDGAPTPLRAPLRPQTLDAEAILQERREKLRKLAKSQAVPNQENNPVGREAPPVSPLASPLPDSPTKYVYGGTHPWAEGCGGAGLHLETFGAPREE
uniref:Uncharacterized protein n=1 Tax=Chromera velia CCMP2878 TaxID=1169474 RepID=A0A0G4IFI1_9ALVE|eukprot:Cvel_13915.t1-p1 / transcript=Cvel_13915.t1 / gene=Cvel_13915 / organism=Chromera_velia_CCMP2878 / gene_product=hypothetical protein / transcript_product=hypothetical protein / location=Cvel_scaffold970:15551-16661(+) / protein_length=169 / sequence_SO=supercontig / SO=protein_coding / is_pseudo=false